MLGGEVRPYDVQRNQGGSINRSQRCKIMCTGNKTWGTGAALKDALTTCVMLFCDQFGAALQFQIPATHWPPIVLNQHQLSRHT